MKYFDFVMSEVHGLRIKFCSPYQIEAGPVEKRLEKEGVPTLRIDTDYGQEDVGQIQTRVEAFVERPRG
jgi:benzoyl-CoA reductase/2-hydroxyglutaryl-CoA dehydratase subunit BcrC/BadD/HgdB